MTIVSVAQRTSCFCDVNLQSRVTRPHYLSQCLEIPEVSLRVSGVRDACEGSAVLGSDAAAVLVTKGWIMGGGAMQV